MEKRIYILVPETVQILVPEQYDFSDHAAWLRDQTYNYFPEYLETIQMESGRLMAQAFHVGRKIERSYSYKKYEEITAIVLAVRNTKELEKVGNEISGSIRRTSTLNCNFQYEEFWDHNPEFYGTEERIHTITAFGPTTQEQMESFIGHLNLYK